MSAGERAAKENFVLTAFVLGTIALVAIGLIISCFFRQQVVVTPFQEGSAFVVHTGTTVSLKVQWSAVEEADRFELTVNENGISRESFRMTVGVCNSGVCSYTLPTVDRKPACPASVEYRFTLKGYSDVKEVSFATGQIVLVCS